MWVDVMPFFGVGLRASGFRASGTPTALGFGGFWG